MGPPLYGAIKINFDAFVNPHMAVADFVICDFRDEPLLDGGKLLTCSSVPFVEPTIAWLGMQATVQQL